MDRELLELAAKAAGIEINATKQANRDGSGYGHLGLWTTTTTNWNPLDNDGDALRLAADLRLLVKPGKHKGDGCTVEAQRPGIAGCTAFYDYPAQQMRQAIVRAAAEIGKAMP